MRPFQVVPVVALLGLGVPSGAPGQALGRAELQETLRNRIEAGRATGEVTAAGRRILAETALPAFYQERFFEPAWMERGELSAHGRELLQALRDAPADGIDPRDYGLPVLDSLAGARGERRDEELLRRTDLELLLTDAFLVFGSHLLHGRIDPRTVEPNWVANRRGADMAAVLARALGGAGVRATLEALHPPQPRYQGLKRALDRYRALAAAGGWPTVPDAGKLEPGTRGPAVEALRRRLAVTGDLPQGPPPEEDGSTPDPDLFDEALASGVRAFQRRHGLEPDGVVGPATLAALNVSAAQRVRQIEVNLERFRWLPEDLGRRHLEVNIAGFRVDVVEEGRPVLTLRTVVGREYRQTPSFTGRMTHLVFSPYWHVPPGIAARDKLPEIKRNPSYVAAQRMTLFDVQTNQAVDVGSVDWSGMAGSEFNRRFRLRQEPGPLNALGGVKFMFPNPYNVYLHDTPSRELFDRAERTFSSGCIRVENPMELAAYLLSGDASWTGERIRAAMGRGVEQTVRLAEPLSVHLLYWTAWFSEDGTVHFRRDVYGRDEVVSRGLAADPPAP